MKVAEVSDATGIPARNIRYYDREGVVSPPRAPNGYRAYTDVEVQELVLLRRARRVGLSVDECRALLKRWRAEPPDGRRVVTKVLTDAEGACRWLRAVGRGA
jgi:DNA-binding transcriptional MerR regulator